MATDGYGWLRMATAIYRRSTRRNLPLNSQARLGSRSEAARDPMTGPEEESMSGLTRWAPISGAVWVVLMVVAFAIAGSSPDTDASNAKIAAYMAKDSNQTKNIVAYVMVAVGILFLVFFYSTLRARLADAEGGMGRSSALVFGAGLLSVAFTFVGISLFVSTLLVAGDADKFPLDPGFYRITQDLGYPLWVAGTMVGSLVAWGTAAVVRGTGVLPGWYAWFSIVVGVFCVVALFFIPIFLFLLWILVTSILLVARPASASPPVQAL